MAALPYKETGSQFGGCEYGHLVPGLAGGHYHIWKFMFFIPSPQTYWTAGVVALGTVGAQNFHDTAKIVSKINKSVHLFSCVILLFVYNLC